MAVYTAFSASNIIPWNDVSVNTLMQSNNGYDVLVNSTLTLPAISNKDDIIEVTNFTGSGFTIQCGAGQEIFGTDAATSVGGSVVTTIQGASIRMVCLTANLVWQILSSSGGLEFN